MIGILDVTHRLMFNIPSDIQINSISLAQLPQFDLDLI